MSSGIVTEFHRERSLNGHSLDVLKSAIQKYTRRSKFDMLLWSLFEFDTLLCGEFSKNTVRIRTNLYHRMLIIYLEDVGPPGIIYSEYMNNLFTILASSRNYTETCDMTSSMYSTYKQYEIEQYIKWAWICSNAVKSRESDWYNIYYTRINQRQPELLKCPQLSEDLKKETSTTVLWCEQLLANLNLKNINAMYWAYKIVQSKINGTYFKKKKPEYLVFWIISKCTSEHLDTYMKWFECLKLNSECFLCWSNLIISHCKTTDHCEANTREHELSEHEIQQYIKQYIEHNSQILQDSNPSRTVKFDEYVYDMHTYIGKIKKRSYKYFAEVSSIVTNEDINIDIDVKNAYIQWFQNLSLHSSSV